MVRTTVPRGRMPNSARGFTRFRPSCRDKEEPSGQRLTPPEACLSFRHGQPGWRDGCVPRARANVQVPSVVFLPCRPEGEVLTHRPEAEPPAPRPCSSRDEEEQNGGQTVSPET